MTYLDWAATTPIDPEIAQGMADAAVEFSGNPSSPYPAGKAAKAALEGARNRCASVLGCDAEQLTFTSGGTEANTIVLLSLLLAREPGTILYSGLEHPSIAEPITMLGRRGWKVKELAPGPDGRIPPKRLAEALDKNPDTRLVAVMGVNNEIGSIQPLEELASEVRAFQKAGKRPIHFHADLVQAAGKTSINLGDLDIDSAAFAAHKIRGPRGVGLLYHRREKFEVLLHGGGQESGIRPGTENVAGALAMAEAFDRYGRPSEVVQRNGEWLLDALANIDGAKVIPEHRLQDDRKGDYVPGIIAVAYPPVPGEVLARVLSESGYAVSTGSACSNNKKGKLPKSMVALGVSKEAATGTIRVSIGAATTRKELESFVEVLRGHLEILRQVNG